MRPAGRFVADVLTRLSAAADVGVNLLDLDRLAHDMIRERGAESCYIDYHPSFGASPFGHVLCTSVNDAVLHGLPHDYVLADGDLLSLDFAATRRRLGRGLRDQPGGRDPARGGPAPDRDRRGAPWTPASRRPWSATGSATSPTRSARSPGRPGYGINLQFGGHGVGRTMHGDPHVPNDGRPRPRLPAPPGAGHRHRAVVPAHHRRDLHRPRTAGPSAAATAHAAPTSEHTIAITESGPLILTARD